MMTFRPCNFSLTDSTGYKSGRLIVFLWLLSLFASTPKIALASCNCQYKSDFIQSIQSSNFAALSELFSNEQVAAACDYSCVQHWKKHAISAATNSASTMIENGEVDAAHKLVSNRGDATFISGDYWNINAVLGDIARARKDWKEAALQYAQAQDNAARDNVNENIQQSLFKLSSEALRLHGSLDITVQRGELTGILGSRGVKPQSIPLPIVFEYNSADLSREGEQGARLIARFLETNGESRAALTGHTDHCGSDTYNQTLSEQRANSLANAVRRHYKNSTGRSIQIDTQGKGESCPPDISQSEYSDSELRSLARRVEFSFGNNAGAQGFCGVAQSQSDADSCP